MVVIKRVSAKTIKDCRGEKTISVIIETNNGKFSASSPNGTSKGKHESKPYIKNIEEDIEKINKFEDYFSKEIIENFNDLRRIEDIVDKHIGANTLVALEYAVLKALAKKQEKEIWQLINPSAKKLPRLVGNCIGGGEHSVVDKKPDFQEFLLIPNLKSVKENFEKNKGIKKDLEFFLKDKDKNFKNKKNYENAWITSLNEREVLDILKNFKTKIGIDVAASSFFKRKNYLYKNPLLKRTAEEQFNYLCNIIENFNIFYIEDPFAEEDFDNFARLLKKFPDRLIVGDDLTVTNTKRLKKAIEKKSINAIIIKPNQCGSLLDMRDTCKIAKENNLKIIFSHRSGETEEDILADLAFGFGADFLKCGIDGKEREVKLKKLMKIEESLR
jgi:enolase